MDKYEYKVRADEIKELIARGEYPQAAEIADTIDWRRVKSVMMLCTISDLYKINRRYEDAKNMLLLAYERRPGGKTICYSLCELCIKTEEFVQAINYYKEFVQVAPKDSGRYILQYKLYEAQDVGLEERIGVLEELKKRDYREKWAYELAYLYHRVGLATRCVEECDELILWFGEGKYVIKAMELKMLHHPLTPSQQEKYDHRFEPVSTPMAEESEREAGEADVQLDGSESEQVSEVQAGWEGSVQETGAEPDIQPEAEGLGQSGAGIPSEWAAQGAAVSEDTRTDWVLSKPEMQAIQEAAAAASAEPPKPEDVDIQVKTVDVGAYNTINLQAEIAAGLQEVLAEDKDQTDAITRSIIAPLLDSDTESLDLPEIDEVDESDLEPAREVMEGTEVFFGETGELGTVQKEELPVTEDAAAVKAPAEEPASEEPVPDKTAKIVMDQLRMESLGRREELVLTAQPPKELAGVLSQESDGQISLVVPESEKLEKQITGQMNLEDILDEWEKLKRENEVKRQEEVRQHVLEQTGNMFTQFEESVKDGLLEQLESEPVESGEELEELGEEMFGGESEEPRAETPGEEPSGEIAEEPGEEAPGEEPEESGRETFGEESSGEIAEEPGEEAPGEEPEESGEETPGEPGEETSGEEPEEFGEETPGEKSKEPGEETPGEKSKEPGEETSGEEPGEFGEETPGEESEEPGEETPGEKSKEPGEETSGEEPEEFGEETPGEEPEEPGGETSGKEPPRESGKETPGGESEESGGEKAESASGQREKIKARALTREEKELYAPFIQSRSGRERLVRAIDSISMAAYTGNVIITGEEGMDTLSLAKNMIREVQLTDRNFSGKVAKISGQGLNSKNVGETLEHLGNGALIVQKASELEPSTAAALQKVLQKENFGIIIILEDTKKAMDKLLKAYPKLRESFTARMDVEAMSNDSLVAFGRQYAREMEYAIDELGVLALHTRIEERQTIDHVVTVLEVKDIVDEAIHHANRKTLGHFFDILFARRYDEEDMIILTEKDFI